MKIQLNIFSRLALGYFAIIVVMGFISGYTLLKLHELNREVDLIFTVDERMLDLKPKVADSILSQLGYGKKYVITKDSLFFNQFLTAEKDFNRYIEQAMSIADTKTKKDSIERITGRYRRYRDLAYEEMESVAMNKPYPKQYTEEMETIVEGILEDLKLLENSSMKDIHNRMDMLKTTANATQSLALIMFAIAMVLVIGTSFMSTRSITNPLEVLVDKTKEISEGVFESGLDITSPPEISELARAVNTMCDKLKKVDTVKSEFFSTMSHELRTPLASIKQGISLLRTDDGTQITEKQKKLLSILSEETNRLIEMVNSILDLSKMEAGMMSYYFCDEYLGPLIRRVITEMAPLIEGKKIVVEANIAKDLPLLKLDRERMLQVMRNLIGNAVKFTPEGGQINISVHRSARGIEVSTSDTGPGIPKENLSVIFDKFHQLPVRSTEWSRGTGLGLAFVKHIIAAHGGKVWAESELGRGSVFTFLLPC